MRDIYSCNYCFVVMLSQWVCCKQSSLVMKPRTCTWTSNKTIVIAFENITMTKNKRSSSLQVQIHAHCVFQCPEHTFEIKSSKRHNCELKLFIRKFRQSWEEESERNDHNCEEVVSFFIRVMYLLIHHLLWGIYYHQICYDTRTFSIFIKFGTMWLFFP